MEGFIQFIFFIVIGLVVFLIIRTTSKKRKELFQGLANQLGFSLTGSGMATIRLHGNLLRKQMSLEFYPAGKNTPASMKLTFNSDQPFTFKLTRQHAFTQIKNQLGFGRDVQIGDKTIDELFEIDAQDSPQFKKLFNSPEAKKNLLGLAGNPFRHIYFSQSVVDYSQTITEKLLSRQFIENIAGLLIGLDMTLAGKPAESDKLFPPVEHDAEEYPPRPKEEFPPQKEQSREPETTVFKQTYPPLGAVNESAASEPPEETQAPQVTPEPSAETQAPPPVSETKPVPPADEEKAMSGVSDINSLIASLKENTISAEDAAFQIVAGGEDWIDQSVRQLKEFQIRDKIKMVLVAMGGKSIPSLIKYADDYSVSYEIKDILSKLNPEAAGVLLENLESIENPNSLKVVVEAIGILKPEGAVDKLGALLEHKDYGVTYQVEDSLRRLGLTYDDINELKK